MRILCFFILLLFSISSGAQAPDSVSARELEGHVQLLASDSLWGRGNGHNAQALAASYIAGEFTKAGLMPFPAFEGFLQPFILDKGKLVAIDTAAAQPTHMHNVIGMLKGKTKPGEIVLVTAHYDALGVEGKGRSATVYNGANDNASGTAAVLALARYFAQRKDNDRTLLFCAFAGEEAGLLGSKLLAGILKPEHLVAGFNIEMIGVAQYGRNRFALIGESHGDLALFVDRYTKAMGTRRVPDAQPEKHLFYSSDNYPFAAKGVPAYTFMSSDDDDRCYHNECDEANRLDYAHMQNVVRTLAAVLLPVVKGEFTPKRMDTRRIAREAPAMNY
jgi:Zn-dependent M28 family amino/carboxypeptidase